ncbi:DUF4249 domain-containing protein [Spirosoma radiotolerans]|uniref:DUF4249 domain-containing protein n=1 Tax=Spirosoma radiotolerans TaxID=1379870 RepID=A0A0E3V8X5_9BACT|nr:DUF4249 domain-containing protein [Spirosoma radiotolerans]AKD57167.1 hypothetical protein SD10_22000 [Spirosoma radiotolerans]
MRSTTWQMSLGCLLCLLLLACVDPEELIYRGTVDVIVVDGTITNLAEPQLIKLNRSRADPLTGRFGVLPITKANVHVVVDSAQIISATEIADGTYQLPSDFRGQVGHAYQLRITLSDGKQLVSTQQVMPTVPPIDNLSIRFNATAFAPGQYPNGFRAGYNCFITTKDPVDQHNYYRWDWKLWEKQHWCRSCYQGYYVDSVQQNYVQNGVLISVRSAVEDCVGFPRDFGQTERDLWFEYTCRTPCWDISQNYSLTLFDDQLTNGGAVNGRQVAVVPFLTRQPALLEMRQVAITASAYWFYDLLQQQTQKTGGLADTPPTAIVGNVTNRANVREAVVGFFTASAVATTRRFLDKNDATVLSFGAYDELGKIIEANDELFYVQTRRIPNPGPDGKPFTAGGPSRFITAPCIPGETRTPTKPEGWPN